MIETGFPVLSALIFFPLLAAVGLFFCATNGPSACTPWSSA
jgi:hypothetical protein